MVWRFSGIVPSLIPVFPVGGLCLPFPLDGFELLPVGFSKILPEISNPVAPNKTARISIIV